MRYGSGFIIITIMFVMASQVTADWCNAKCDAIFYAGETVMRSTIFSIIPGSRNWLNSIGMRSGNQHHSECVTECGTVHPSQICKRHCDIVYSVGRLAFKVAPAGVVQVSEALGHGVSEADYQRCVSTCLQT